MVRPRINSLHFHYFAAPLLSDVSKPKSTKKAPSNRHTENKESSLDEDTEADSQPMAALSVNLAQSPTSELMPIADDGFEHRFAGKPSTVDQTPTGKFPGLSDGYPGKKHGLLMKAPKSARFDSRTFTLGSTESIASLTGSIGPAGPSHSGPRREFIPFFIVIRFGEV